MAFLKPAEFSQMVENDVCVKSVTSPQLLEMDSSWLGGFLFSFGFGAPMLLALGLFV